MLLKHHFISTLYHSNMLNPMGPSSKSAIDNIAAAWSTKWVTRCKIQMS